MTTRITAEAVILGRDETGSAFKSVEGKIAALTKKFRDVGRAAGISAQIDKLTESLKRQTDQLAGIDRLRTAEEKLARLSTRNAQQKAIAEEQANARTAAAAQRAAAGYYKQLDAVNALRRNLEGAGIAVNKLASEEARLRGAIDGTTGALARQNRALVQAAEHEAQLAHRQEQALRRQERLRHGATHVGRHLLGGAMGMGAAAGGGYMVARTVENAAHQGALLQHERVRMQAAGMRPEEVKEAEEEAAKLSGKYRPFAPADIMHLLRNARSVVGNYHEAAEVADPLMALRTVALGAHPGHADELEADFDKLIKGMEIKGVTQDPARFRHYIDNMAKAINVFGDTLRPTDYYQMFKYGRQSTNATSDKFMLEVAPTLAQELGGSSAGKGLENVYQHLVGGHMAQTSVQSLNKLGLIDGTKVSRTKTGAIKGVLPGGVKGTDMPGGWNFYDWIQQYYLPGLTKAGITSENDVQQHIATDFGTGTATQIASIFATQQGRIEKDRGLLRNGAEGISAADRFMTSDALMAWMSVKSQLAGTAQETGAPLMGSAASGLNSLAGGLHAIGEAAHDHPYLATGGALGIGGGVAAGAGYLGYQWLTAGAQLSASATALDASAAALTSAAEVLAGKGVIPGAAPEGGAPTKAGGGFWSRLLGTGLPMLGIGQILGNEVYSNPDKYPMLQRDYLPPSVQKMLDTGEPPASAAQPLVRAIDGGAGPETLKMLRDRDAEDLGPKIRSSLEGLKATVQEPIKVDPVELKGAADVRVTVQVNGDGKVTGQFASSSGNIKASVGASMPSLSPGHPPPT